MKLNTQNHVLLNGFQQIFFKKEVCRMRQLQQTDRGQPLAPAYLLCTLRDIKHLTSSTNSADNTHLGLNDSDKTKTRLKTSSSVLILSRNVYRVTRGIINALSRLEDSLLLSREVPDNKLQVRPENLISDSHDVCSELIIKLSHMLSTYFKHF